ncbi:MAG: cytochrome c [Alphaproteobacteria bacterium]|jgi:cytochrome c556|nr:cytochrome c [Alphaproteobacteria bacterium]
MVSNTYFIEAIMNRYFTFAFAMLALMGMISHSAMADPIADRKENFRNNVKSLKLIQPALAAGDMDVIAGEANRIADWAKVMPDYFPEGSDMGDTKARPEIWENWADFTAKAEANYDAAVTLAELAAAGDTDALPMAMKALSDTCGACHKLYKY